MSRLHLVSPANTPPRVRAALDVLSDALAGAVRIYDLSREETILAQSCLLGALVEDLAASRDRDDSLASVIMAAAAIALASAHTSAAARADADREAAPAPQDEPEVAAVKARREAGRA